MAYAIQVENIDREISVDPITGKGKATIRGTARIVGVSHVALVGHFQAAVTTAPSKLAQLLIDCGFEPGNFAADGIPDTAVAIIAYYYACDANKPTPEAKIATLIFSSKGARDWMQEVKGWQRSDASILKLTIWKLQQTIFALEAKIKHLLPSQHSDPYCPRSLLQYCLDLGLPVSSADYLVLAELAFKIKKAVKNGQLPYTEVVRWSGKKGYVHSRALDTLVKDFFV